MSHLIDTSAFPTGDDIDYEGEKEVELLKTLTDGSTVIAVPSYQKFNDAVLALQGTDVVIENIAGHTDILMSVIVPGSIKDRPFFAYVGLVRSTNFPSSIQALIRINGSHVSRDSSSCSSQSSSLLKDSITFQTQLMVDRPRVLDLPTTCLSHP